MKNKAKKIMALACVLAMLISTMTIFPVNATDDIVNVENIGKSYGFDLEAEQEYFERVIAPKIALGDLVPYRPSTSIARSATDIPSSFDNSTSPYFPAIGDQGQTNSCVAFATTYYQFTYEANKLKNIVTTPANTCSPQWTFSHINYGLNRGSDFGPAYYSLSAIGSIRYGDYESGEIDTVEEFVTHWSTNTNAAIEALGIKGEEEAIVFGDFDPINSADCIAVTFDTNTESDYYLDGIKSGLASGDIYAFGCNMSYNEMTASSQGTHAGEKVAVRNCYNAGQDSSLGHALTIVGYDDNISVDVNGDGVIESAEKGAFKIANSWGTEWGNDGYIWILYDALNGETKNSDQNWEESLAGTYRQPFIRQQMLYKLNVYENVSEIFMMFDYETDCKFNIDVYTNRIESGSAGAGDLDYTMSAGKSNVYRLTNAPFDGKIVLDYAQSTDTIEDYYTGATWTVGIFFHDELEHDTINSTEIRSVTYVDNKLNTIKSYSGALNNPDYYWDDYTSLGSYEDEFSTNIDLSIGDINYDGVIDTTDEAVLRAFIIGSDVPSTLQEFLGDLNNDGELTGRDSLLLKTLINS